MKLKRFLQFGIFGVIVILVIVGLFYSLANKTTSPIISFVGEKPTPVAKEKKTEAVIVSVGDIFLHDTNINAAFNPTTKTYDFGSVFSAVADYFTDADLSTAWLGAVYDPQGPYSGYPLFKSPPALIETLQNIGMDAVFRTNHAMDFGVKGLNLTTQILEQHNIAQIASAATEEDSKKIFVYQKDDLKIAYLGYIYGMNGLPIPQPWMANLIDHEKIKNDIAQAKQQVDFVVVALHFGNEYERFPNAWQKETVQKIADAGADLIIGSHVHVIQPVDTVTTTDGRTVYVAYGLGNFYCDQRDRYTDAGMILKYKIEKNDGKTTLKEISYLPTAVVRYKENGKNQFKVLPAKEYIDLYEQGQAPFLSATNFSRLKQVYQDTVEHLDNPGIGFVESRE
ncbi:MAG: CapA family protein [bacterium]|nr:CapA family protein [bacterium]